MRAVVVALLALPLVACGGDDGGGGGGSPDAPLPTPDAPAFETCEGSCQTTALTATFGADTRVLDLAFYGVTKDPSGTSLHVEAYRGAGMGCPEMSSPTPDYTLILGVVPVPTSTTPITSPANLLDYQGDLLDGPLGAAATQVMLAPVAARVCTTCVGLPAPSDSDGMIAVDVSVTFAAGTVQGHLYATHCDSLDSFEP